jgi:hypothetical protein
MRRWLTSADGAQGRLLPGGWRRSRIGSSPEQLAAVLFSVLETLRLWELNAQQWLTGYLTACAANGGTAPADLRPWLPWRMTEAERGEMKVVQQVGARRAGQLVGQGVGVSEPAGGRHGCAGAGNANCYDHRARRERTAADDYLLPAGRAPTEGCSPPLATPTCAALDPVEGVHLLSSLDPAEPLYSGGKQREAGNLGGISGDPDRRAPDE